MSRPTYEYPRDTWQERHRWAMTSPTRQEAPIVGLMFAIRIVADRFDGDYVMRPGVAQIITGTRTLLAGDWGSRLDMGTLDGDLSDAAKLIGFCLDHEIFGCEHG